MNDTGKGPQTTNNIVKIEVGKDGENDKKESNNNDTKICLFRIEAILHKYTMDHLCIKLENNSMSLSSPKLQHQLNSLQCKG